MANLYPALSASIPYVQGASVKSEYWALRSLPAMGRGPNELFFSGSGGTYNVSEANFFNDAVVGKVATAGSLEANFSSDEGKLESRFGYTYIGFTRGLTDIDPLPGLPFQDKSRFDPVQYLTNSASITWPVVNEDPAAIDILDYNGVIEPLTIRHCVGMSSTFVGDNLDPEPHTIKGALSGKYVTEPYHRFNPITSFYAIGDSNRDYPFSYVVDWRLYEGFSQFVPDSTYTNNDNTKSRPFVESTIEEIVFRDVTDGAMRSWLMFNHKSASMDDRPAPYDKTKPRGFTYENCVFGSDSIAFGGLTK
jgi:hypothetical protein